MGGCHENVRKWKNCILNNRHFKEKMRVWKCEITKINNSTIKFSYRTCLVAHLYKYLLFFLGNEKNIIDFKDYKLH